VLSTGLLGLGVALVLVAFLSITLGSRAIGLTEVLRALTSLGAAETINDTVTLELRVPRTLLGILAGAALGVAGAMLQGRYPQPAGRRRDHGYQLGGGGVRRLRHHRPRRTRDRLLRLVRLRRGDRRDRAG
jgi:hypothetical protein